MYCNNCKVHVESATGVCPLCHEKLEGVPSNTPQYPPRKPRKNYRPVSASEAYVALSLPVILVCALVNGLVTPHSLWAVDVVIGILYIYFTLKTAVFYRGPGGAKIFAQTILLTILVVCMQYIFGGREWAFSYAMPVITMSSVAAHLILVLVFRRRKGNQYFRYMWLTSLVGVIPAILFSAGVATYEPLAYASFCVSGISIILLLIFSLKTIAEEVRKKSHI